MALLAGLPEGELLPFSIAVAAPAILAPFGESAAPMMLLLATAAPQRAGALFKHASAEAGVVVIAAAGGGVASANAVAERAFDFWVAIAQKMQLGDELVKVKKIDDSSPLLMPSYTRC